MRADRLLAILLLLQGQRRLTARALAERLEVCERTILRDMEALGAAGIPVVAERGAGGGWSLLDSYQTRLTGLTPVEIQALFLTPPARLLADLGLERAAEGARVKLQAALPATRRQDAADVRGRIYVDVAGWHQPEEALPCLPALQEAVFQEKQLQIRYSRDGTVSERVVDPLGLVAKGSTWYLVAGVEGEIRTYRVSRIAEATVTAAPCVRPPDFDLAAYWTESSAAFLTNLPRYPAVLRVAPSLVPRLRTVGRFARVEAVDPPDAAGWSRVAVLFETDWEAAEYVLSFGAAVAVLDPPALRAEVIRRAAAVVALYEGPL